MQLYTKWRRNVKYYKISDKKMVGLLFSLCWLVYFSSYLGRLNYSAALAEIISAEGFSKAQAGMIGTGFFMAYGIGQIISGFLGDKLSPKWMIFTGVSVSALLNFVMSILSRPDIMAAVWAVNGLAQSLIWSPMLRLLFEYLKPEDRQRACININSSMPLGTMTAYGMTAIIVAFSDWRMTFTGAAVLLFLVACIWQVGMKKIECHGKIAAASESANQEDKRRERAEKESKLENKTGVRGHSFRVILISSGLVFILFAMMVQGALKDGVTTWIPTYVKETYGVTSVMAIMSTMLIPMFNLLGVYMASMAERKWFHDEVKTAGAFFALCAVSLLILFGISGKNMVLTIGMLAVSTTSMMAVNTMLISVLPSRFGIAGKASSISGILNSAVYLGSAVSTYGIGAMSVSMGWNNTILIWFGLAVIAGGICFGVRNVWKRYKDRYLKQ